MRCATTFAFVLAFAASALSQALDPTPWYSYIYFPYENQTIGAGTTYFIEWDASELVGPATLYLLGGNDADTLRTLSTIAHVDVNDAEYTWAVGCSLGKEKAYLIKIASDLDNGKTYGISPIFHIEGPGCHSSYSGGPTSHLPKPTGYLPKPRGYPTK
ncbi:hypothetical protein F5Y12DRAFT_706342 [Xylaria sp. FL1777]|nr:hypothetical protein F5Y12DRAFT_706342 [Xylaria sp. FL1777]